MDSAAATQEAADAAPPLDGAPVLSSSPSLSLDLPKSSSNNEQTPPPPPASTDGSTPPPPPLPHLLAAVSNKVMAMPTTPVAPTALAMSTTNAPVSSATATTAATAEMAFSSGKPMPSPSPPLSDGSKPDKRKLLVLTPTTATTTTTTITTLTTGRKKTATTPATLTTAAAAAVKKNNKTHTTTPKSKEKPSRLPSSSSSSSSSSLSPSPTHSANPQPTPEPNNDLVAAAATAASLAAAADKRKKKKKKTTKTTTKTKKRPQKTESEMLQYALERCNQQRMQLNREDYAKLWAPTTPPTLDMMKALLGDAPWEDNDDDDDDEEEEEDLNEDTVICIVISCVDGQRRVQMGHRGTPKIYYQDWIHSLGVSWVADSSSTTPSLPFRTLLCQAPPSCLRCEAVPTHLWETTLPKIPASCDATLVTLTGQLQQQHCCNTATTTLPPSSTSSPGGTTTTSSGVWGIVWEGGQYVYDAMAKEIRYYPQPCPPHHPLALCCTSRRMRPTWMGGAGGGAGQSTPNTTTTTITATASPLPPPPLTPMMILPPTRTCSSPAGGQPTLTVSGSTLRLPEPPASMSSLEANSLATRDQKQTPEDALTRTRDASGTLLPPEEDKSKEDNDEEEEEKPPPPPQDLLVGTAFPEDSTVVSCPTSTLGRKWNTVPVSSRKAAVATATSGGGGGGGGGIRRGHSLGSSTGTARRGAFGPAVTESTQADFYQKQWSRLLPLTATQCEASEVAMVYGCSAVRKSRGQRPWASLLGFEKLGMFGTKEEAIKRAVCLALVRGDGQLSLDPPKAAACSPTTAKKSETKSASGGHRLMLPLSKKARARKGDDHDDEDNAELDMDESVALRPQEDGDGMTAAAAAALDEEGVSENESEAEDGGGGAHATLGTAAATKTSAILCKGAAVDGTMTTTTTTAEEEDATDGGGGNNNNNNNNNNKRAKATPAPTPKRDWTSMLLPPCAPAHVGYPRSFQPAKACEMSDPKTGVVLEVFSSISQAERITKIKRPVIADVCHKGGGEVEGVYFRFVSSSDSSLSSPSSSLSSMTTTLALATPTTSFKSPVLPQKRKADAAAGAKGGSKAAAAAATKAAASTLSTSSMVASKAEQPKMKKTGSKSKANLASNPNASSAASRARIPEKAMSIVSSLSPTSDATTTACTTTLWKLPASRLGRAKWMELVDRSTGNVHCNFRSMTVAAQALGVDVDTLASSLEGGATWKNAAWELRFSKRSLVPTAYVFGDHDEDYHCVATDGGENAATMTTTEASFTLSVALAKRWKTKYTKDVRRLALELKAVAPETAKGGAKKSAPTTNADESAAPGEDLATEETTTMEPVKKKPQLQQQAQGKKKWGGKRTPNKAVAAAAAAATADSDQSEEHKEEAAAALAAAKMADEDALMEDEETAEKDETMAVYSRLCIVCQDAKADIVFEPCCHAVLCQRCCELGICDRFCPLCRLPIAQRTKPLLLQRMYRGYHRPRIVAAHTFM